MSWDDEAATWDEEPAVRAYSGAAFESLLRALDARGASLDGARVLDFGCGTGPAMIEVLRAKALANVVGLSGDLAELAGSEALAPRSFDLITCSSVCGFLPDYPGAVATLADLLVPGGLFVQWDWELMPDADEPMGLSRDGIRAALFAAGLSDVHVDIGFELALGEYVMAPLIGVGMAAVSRGV